MRLNAGSRTWEEQGGESIAGYIPKCVLFGAREDKLPVYDESRQHIIGYMVPERGFVPL